MPLRQDLGRCTLKSFTRNQTNLRALGAEKRLDVLAKKQTAEHEHALSGHNKEMQSLRDSLNLSLEKFESVSQGTSSSLADFKEQATYAINLLKARILSQETTIAEQKKSLESFQDQLLNFHMLYSSMRDVDNIKKKMEAQVKEATGAHLCSLQDLQREFKIDFSILKDDLDKFKEDADRRLSEQSNRIEQRYNLNKMDREGVTREIRIREKELFIIEKKIENIYTLIERINKRGELCHKPE
jgi:uncharacterized coiled-coil protein SlyX